jgi:hypothetical protein
LLRIPRGQQIYLNWFEPHLIDNVIYAIQRSVHLWVELEVPYFGIGREFQLANPRLDAGYGVLGEATGIVAQRVTQLAAHVRHPRLANPWLPQVE